MNTGSSSSSSMSSVTFFNEQKDSRKIVLTNIRRIQKVTMPDCNEMFVTSEQRTCMNEIARVDPALLDETVRQFIFKNNLTDKTTPKGLPQLREIFTQELTKVYVNLPGDDNEDEEWERSLNQNYQSFLFHPSESSSEYSTTYSSPIENPWITQNSSTTKMPEEFEKYLEGIAFLDRYEIIRILRPFGPIEPTNSFWNQVQTKYGLNICQFLHDVCFDYYSNTPNVNVYIEMNKMVNRNLTNIWHLSLTKFPQSGPRVHVLFSGDILFKDDKLILTLNPPTIGYSKRYYRTLSSERFLHLKIKNINSLDNDQKSKLKELLLFPLSLAGKIYEFLYAKSNILYYFATSGSDISDSMSIWEVINFNIPIELNKNMTTSKLYSRISLGFSDTTPTITFKLEEILCVDDITINGHCFTDGCAAISLAAMKEVAEILGCKETPSAIQGRIGGAKGVWYINPSKDFGGLKWIELRKSQIKYQHNLGDNDIHLRTLEISHVVVPPKKPGALNSQLIRILFNGGVKAGVFVNMMKEHIEKIKSGVIECDDPRFLIAWLTNNSNIMRIRLETFYNHYFQIDLSDEEKSFTSYDDENSNIDLSMDLGSEGYNLSGFPDNPSERCIQMLHAGFVPSSCPYLAKNLKNVFSKTLNSLFTKFRINIWLSRVLICIADPTRTLKPGEVFIQLDKEVGHDERTGLPFGIIEGDIILARNPCRLPSDIVKVKGVKNMDLSIYYNVVIFPVNVANEDDLPLATYLSGGDYDGDKIFCCWDPQIVNSYNNSPLVPLDSRVEDAFDKDNQTIDESLSFIESSQFGPKVQETILDIYFKDLETPLGLYDRLHTLQSSEFGIYEKQSIYLAQMNAKLVDALKQGLTIKASTKQEDNKIFSKVPVPYWMKKDESRSKSKQEINVDFGVKGTMNSLCNAIESGIDEAVNSKKLLEIEIDPDSHIVAFWNNEMARAQKMKKDSLYLDDLNSISKCMSQLVQSYNDKYAQILGDQNQEEDEDEQLNLNLLRRNEEFRALDYEFLVDFLNAPQVDQYKSKTFKFLRARRSSFLESGIDPLAVFELKLKAASLYNFSFGKKPNRQICWTVAFRALCNIKSQMLESERHPVIGGPRSIINDIWQASRVDERWLDHKREPNPNLNPNQNPDSKQS